MYSVYVDGFCIYNDAFITEETLILDPVLSLSDNNAGTFKFKITPHNIAYNNIFHLISTVTVFKENVEMWEGRVIEESIDFYNNRNITCEGCLAYLNDTTQPQAEYHDMSVEEFLKTLIRIHNSKVNKDRQFEVGTVTVKDPNDSIYRFTNYEKTIKCLSDKLVDSFGGHFIVRKENGIRYLDYLSDYPNENTQTIRFGSNLLDYTRTYDLTSFATVILPLGATIQQEDQNALPKYVTVESVNENSLYVKSEEAIAIWGWIEKVVYWDDVTEPANLLSKSKLYLEDSQFEDMILELSAVDLHYLNPDIESVKLLDVIRVESSIHGLDRLFPVTELTIYLDRPEESEYTLGYAARTSLTNLKTK